MKGKAILLTFLTSIVLTAQAQNNKIPGMSDCKLVHDKKADRDYFKYTDTSPEAPVGFNTMEFIQANFRLPKKTYSTKDKVNFAYIIEKDGTVTFLKLLSLTNDKEIEEEAKRITSLMPKHLAARCGKEYVASMRDISFSVDWMHETLSR